MNSLINFLKSMLGVIEESPELQSSALELQEKYTMAMMAIHAAEKDRHAARMARYAAEQADFDARIAAMDVSLAEMNKELAEIHERLDVLRVGFKAVWAEMDEELAELKEISERVSHANAVSAGRAIALAGFGMMIAG